MKFNTYYFIKNKKMAWELSENGENLSLLGVYDF